MFWGVENPALLRNRTVRNPPLFGFACNEWARQVPSPRAVDSTDLMNRVCRRSCVPLQAAGRAFFPRRTLVPQGLFSVVALALCMFKGGELLALNT